MISPSELIVIAAVPPASLIEPPSSKIMSFATLNTPGTETVDAAPAPIVTSTSPSVACSPSRTKPAVSVVVVPSLSATKKDSFPASSVLSASETSATIFAKVVCACAASSPTNSITPMSSPSAPAAPLSLTN